ncbi:MAG: phosphomannomutase/phosphoglucomutase [Candidatus Aenigmatarchaeota archaeon]
MSVFKAYDVRGIYPKELDEKIAYIIGRAFGTLFSGRIVVGGDARLSTPKLKESLINGLMDSGIEVIDIGFVPTPIVYFACYGIGFDFGISVTGSHLPKEHNGMKFCNSKGIPIGYEDGLEKVEELTKTKYFKKGVGKIEKLEVVKKYSNFIKSLVHESLDGFKIVVDGANGIAGKIYSDILRECGLEVIEIYCEPDGNFPNHVPDPMQKEFMLDLEKKVKEIGADLGFGFDGDGDRVLVVDKNGSINPNHIFSILIEDAIKNGDKVIHDVLCSKLVEDVIRKKGGTPIVSRVGHTFIARKCIEENAVMGGEFSGHYFFKESNYTDDVLVACIKLLSVLKKTGKSVSELTSSYPKYYSYADRLPVREEEKFKFIENLKDKLKKDGYEIVTLDGVRVNFKHGWMLFRPSNTEAKISVGLESSDKEEFEKIKLIAEEIIKTIPR